MWVREGSHGRYYDLINVQWALASVAQLVEGRSKRLPVDSW